MQSIHYLSGHAIIFNMQKPLPYIILFIFLALAFIAASSMSSGNSFLSKIKSDFDEHVIYVHDDVAIHVAVADTALEHQQGLGGRELMAAGQGMLFVFDESKRWRIWMKDMNFGIDILWLDEGGKVVDIREYVYPETYDEYDQGRREVFEPRESARYILEVLVGFSGANGIRVGDVIELGL